MSEPLRVIVRPAPREPDPGRPYRFEALVDSEVLLTSDQPMVDAARKLLECGAAPETLATMRHEGGAYSFVPMPLGEWAKWSYSERDRRGLTRERWVPFAGPRSRG